MYFFDSIQYFGERQRLNVHALLIRYGDDCIQAGQVGVHLDYLQQNWVVDILQLGQLGRIDGGPKRQGELRKMSGLF